MVITEAPGYNIILITYLKIFIEFIGNMKRTKILQGTYTEEER